MISTQSQKINGKLKNPFSSMLNPYREQKLALKGNINALKHRFPNQSQNKTEQLLEQLDNNVQMVFQILQEEQGSRMIPQKASRNNNMALTEQNRLLKSAIVRLYKKLIASQKESQEAQKTNKKLIKQNEDLKLQNTYLLEKQFNKDQIGMDDQVY